MGTNVPMHKEAKNVYGFALITEEGVLYLDEPYSCSKAIKEKWVQPDNDIELVEVVSINPKKQEIEIRIKGVRVRCHKLPQIDAESIEWIYGYYAKMVHLKKLKKSKNQE